MAALRKTWERWAVCLSLAFGGGLSAASWAQPQQRPNESRLDYAPAAYAIRGATVVVSPERTVEQATVVVRNGRIEAVGPVDQTPVPHDARVIEGEGLHVYAGFLDLYTTLGVPADASRSQNGNGRTIPYADFAFPRTPPDNRTKLTPEFEVASVLDWTDSAVEERRGLGFTVLLAAPGGTIAAGRSALVSLSGLPRREALMQTPLALHIGFRSSTDRLADLAHDHEAQAQIPLPPQVEPSPSPAPSPSPGPPASPSEPPVSRRRSSGGPSGYPMSLMGEVAHLRQAMLDAEHSRIALAAYESGLGSRPAHDPALEVLRAARGKTLPVWWEANTRDEIHRALDLAEEFGTTAVIVGGREAHKVIDRLKAAKVPVVLRLDFGEEPKVPSEADYRRRTAEEREEPLRVLAHERMEWRERVAVARVLHEAGVPFAFCTDGLTKVDTFSAVLRQVIAEGLPREAALAALTRNAAEIVGQSTRLGTIEPGKLGHLVALSAPFDNEAAKVRHVLADGFHFDRTKPTGNGDRKKSAQSEIAERKKPPGEPSPDTNEPPKAEPPSRARPDTTEARTEQARPSEGKREAQKKAAQPPDAEPETPTTPFVDVATEFDEDRVPRLKTGGDVLIQDATILTVTGGTIPRGSILIRYGKIAAVGESVEAPEGITVIKGQGLVAMPGIIDTHSHIAISGGVNEMSLSIVPEARVKDVVRGDDVNIYRQAAGGVTAARLLHGSANTIGGQDAVIKLKYGRAARDLVLKDAPQGVKFALGENVTRSTGRFPNTRMGVEATIDRALAEGRAYQARWRAYEARKASQKDASPPPPRRDLRLEALAGILDGSIKIHSHCYRADEILMLLRVAERHNVRVRSLQHVLEGYKVAAEIAEHGASASTFSDWWAYKVEAYDAIPHNAALLTEAGVPVCVKSDSEELARHLYVEAAKMVKYGGVSEEQALAMITINPARELGLDQRIGSIEVGKDGDLALFNGHPFDAFSRCQLTLVEGEVTFQRQEPDGGFAPRGVEFAAMPGASAEVRRRVLDLSPSPDGTYALVGATLHPVSGPDITEGILIVKAGQIAALGGPETPIPAGARTIDVKRLDIWPGMIDAGNIVGLFEIGSLRETQDHSDSAQHQPELRASSALHPDSELIPVTRANGVLSEFVMPGGGSISGQGCLIALEGWVPAEMVLVDQAALIVTIPPWVPTDPERRNRLMQPMRQPGQTPPADPLRRRRERLEAIEEQFRLALEYDRVTTQARAQNDPTHPPDPRLEALVPYAKGEKPVVFRADHRGEILDALRIARDHKLKAILSGGGDAWKVLDPLKAAGVPVLVSGTMRMPLDPSDPYDAPYANPARLRDAGIPFAIRASSTADQGTSSRNLPYEAAMAVAHGLPVEEALKAVTLYPAQILGVADRLGSLEVGKRADLVITAGHLLQPTTEVKGLFIGGKPLPAESKHTRLYRRYQTRLAEVKAGKARLGLERTAKTPSTSSGVAPPTNPSVPGNGR